MTASPSSAAPAMVERSIELGASPDELWTAITDEALLAEWLASEVELEPWEGGHVAARHEDGTESRGEVEVISEAERLSFHWHRDGGAPSRVDLHIDAIAGGTRLTVVETRLGPAGPSLAANAWAPRLRTLRGVLGRGLVLA